MLWIIVRIAALITALMSSASAEEGLASRYGRASGTQVVRGIAQRERTHCSSLVSAVWLTSPRHESYAALAAIALAISIAR
jgi:hypothetical protein